eukprot:gene13719-biopygen10421
MDDHIRGIALRIPARAMERRHGYPFAGQRGSGARITPPPFTTAHSPRRRGGEEEMRQRAAARRASTSPWGGICGRAVPAVSSVAKPLTNPHTFIPPTYSPTVASFVPLFDQSGEIVHRSWGGVPIAGPQGLGGPLSTVTGPQGLGGSLIQARDSYPGAVLQRILLANSFRGEVAHRSVDRAAATWRYTPIFGDGVAYCRY